MQLRIRQPLSFARPGSLDLSSASMTTNPRCPTVGVLLIGFRHAMVTEIAMSFRYPVEGLSPKTRAALSRTWIPGQDLRGRAAPGVIGVLCPGRASACRQLCYLGRQPERSIRVRNRRAPSLPTPAVGVPRHTPASCSDFAETGFIAACVSKARQCGLHAGRIGSAPVSFVV